MTSDEQKLDDLPTPERVLLWAMRVWVIGHCRQQDVSARIETALREHDADGALGYLEGFMLALSHGARRPLEVLCLCRTEVSADERQLLHVFSLLQQDEADEAQAMLCSLINERAATAGIRSAEALAQEFLQAGLALPWDAAGSGWHRVTDLPRVLH